MIIQKRITTKTDVATLTYAEMGDIVVNSATDITITLPSPHSGLWYRVTSVGDGIISVAYSGTMATLKTHETALCFSNGATSWFFAKHANLMTKAEIESVLTGAITSHTHNYAPSPLISADAPTTSTVGAIGQLYIETTTPTIYYCSSIEGEVYTWTQLSGGGGASAFIDLTDAPSSYSGYAGQTVKVNAGETGVEFGYSTPIVVKAVYATLTDLQTAHPTGSAGDAYAVGTATTNEIYIWDVDTSAWASIGGLKGPAGSGGGGSDSIWGGM